MRDFCLIMALANYNVNINGLIYLLYPKPTLIFLATPINVNSSKFYCRIQLSSSNKEVEPCCIWNDGPGTFILNNSQWWTMRTTNCNGSKTTRR